MVGGAKGGLHDYDVGWHHGQVCRGHVAVGDAAVVASVQAPHATDFHHEHCSTEHMPRTAHPHALYVLQERVSGRFMQQLVTVDAAGATLQVREKVDCAYLFSAKHVTVATWTDHKLYAAQKVETAPVWSNLYAINCDSLVKVDC